MTTSRLKEHYRSQIVPALRERFEYGNPMEVPRLEKIVINSGVGEAVQEPKALDTVLTELTAITGQQPAVRRSKKAISNFKLRQGMPIGAVVTLRRDRMYEFFDRLIFPEIVYDRVDQIRGMNITFVTSARTDEEAKELLRQFGVPFSN